MVNNHYLCARCLEAHFSQGPWDSPCPGRKCHLERLECDRLRWVQGIRRAEDGQSWIQSLTMQEALEAMGEATRAPGQGSPGREYGAGRHATRPSADRRADKAQRRDESDWRRRGNQEQPGERGARRQAEREEDVGWFHPGKRSWDYGQDTQRARASDDAPMRTERDKEQREILRGIQHKLEGVARDIANIGEATNRLLG